jgi:hypothetical protein
VHIGEDLTDAGHTGAGGFRCVVSSEMGPDGRFRNDSRKMNESPRVSRRRNPGRSDDLTSAYVGIQALLEVAEDNDIKLAGNWAYAFILENGTIANNKYMQLIA